MQKNSYKSIIVALLLLTFTCQSFASMVMPCQLLSQSKATPSMDHMDHSSMDNMDHANMVGMHHAQMEGMEPLGNPSSIDIHDCCKTIGQCSSLNCSVAFLAHVFDLKLLVTAADVNPTYLSRVPQTIVSSLFRPPIFC